MPLGPTTTCSDEAQPSSTNTATTGYGSPHFVAIGLCVVDRIIHNNKWQLTIACGNMGNVYKCKISMIYRLHKILI